MDYFCERMHAFIKRLYHFGSGPFLGSIDISGPVGTAEGVLYIAGDCEAGFFQLGMYGTFVYLFDVCQFATPFSYWLTALIDKTKS